MDHENLKDQVFLYHDPETSEDERQVLARHLQDCEECRLSLKQWEQIQAKISKTALAPSPVFAYRVMERLHGVTGDRSKDLSPSAAPAFLKWLFPTLGYSLALGLMVAVIAHQEVPINTETILLADFPHASQWTFGNEAPDAGDLVGIREEVK